VYRDAHELTASRQTLKPEPDGTIVEKLFPDHAMLIVPRGT